MNRFSFLVCLSASVLFVATASVNTTGSSFTRSSSLHLHPSSFRLHPFPQQQTAKTIKPEALKKYIGRYALDAGIIPISTLDVTLENNELWVTSMGNYAITVFPVTATGNATPLRVIRGGPAGRVPLMIGNPGAVGYDKKRDELLVPN